MLDTTLKPKIDPYLKQIAEKLGEIGIGPNQITLYGFVIGFIGCVAIGLQSYIFGLFLILLNRLADGLDGAVARFNTENTQTKPNPFGAYLDIILDMILFGAFVFLFMLGQPNHAATAAFLMFSFIGIFATSLGHHIIGTQDTDKLKSFYHPTRLIEGTEMIIFMILVCLYPAYFSAIAVLFGIICWITTIARIWYAYWDLKKSN